MCEKIKEKNVQDKRRKSNMEIATITMKFIMIDMIFFLTSESQHIHPARLLDCYLFLTYRYTVISIHILR